ncbi:hypothetical protein Tco_0920203 [Tanacetum coccineum]
MMVLLRKYGDSSGGFPLAHHQIPTGISMAQNQNKQTCRSEVTTRTPEKLLGDKGLSSGGTKLNLVFITAKIVKNITDSQSPEEGVGRAIPEYKIGSTSRATNINPNEMPELKKKPYPSSLLERTSASAAQQMTHNQKRNSEKQNLSTNRNTNRKRPREQSEQWTSNKISFPSISWCQLVDSPIILEALIEGFWVRMIYVDRGSSFEGSPAKSEKFRSCGLHYPLNDKVSHRQWDCNNDYQERNPPRMSEDVRSTRTGHGREDHSPQNASI